MNAALVEYSSGAETESSEEKPHENTPLPSPEPSSQRSDGAAAPVGLKRKFNHVEGRWAATVMMMGVYCKRSLFIFAVCLVVLMHVPTECMALQST